MMMYLVGHYNGTLQEIQGKVVSENMISKIDDEGQHYLLIDKLSITIK